MFHWDVSSSHDSIVVVKAAYRARLSPGTGLSGIWFSSVNVPNGSKENRN